MMSLLEITIGALLGLITAIITIVPLKGKVGMFFLGFLIRLVWIVGAIRLAKPQSVWARTFYDEARMAEAIRRFPISDSPHQLAMPALRPVPPREVRIGCWLLLVAGVVMLNAHFTFGLLAGPLIVFTVLARHGVDWARATAVIIVGLSTLLQVALIVSGAALSMAVVTVTLTALLFTVALAMLYHPAVVDFYRFHAEPYQ